MKLKKPYNTYPHGMTEKRCHPSIIRIMRALAGNMWEKNQAYPAQQCRHEFEKRDTEPLPVQIVLECIKTHTKRAIPNTPARLSPHVSVNRSPASILGPTAIHHFNAIRMPHRSVTALLLNHVGCST